MNIKRLIIMCGLVIIGVFICIWVFSHGYIEVTAKSPGYKLVITDQKTGKKTELKPATNTIKRFVARGSYEIFVSQSEQSYVAIVKTGGFLGTTLVDAHVSAENSRKFVGDNPGPCMYYTGSILYSFGCSDRFTQAAIHTPATATQPTTTQKNSGALNGFIEAFIKTKQGSQVIVRAPDVDEESGGPQNVFTVADGSWNIKDGYVLNKLGGDTTYTASSYKDGFLAHKTDSSKAYYYASVSDDGKEIELTNPKTKDAQLVSVTTEHNKILSLYTTNNERSDSKNSSLRGKSEVVIEGESQEAIHYTFKQVFSSAELCGDNIVCLFGNNGLLVYQLDGSKATLSYQVHGAKWVHEINKRLYILTGEGVISFDSSTQTGFLSYSFGGYQPCGVQAYDKGFVLCVINKKANKVALAIDVTRTNTSSIDKKVAELVNIPVIKKVSAYDKFIFISPDLGDLVYDETAHSFTYDPNKKAVVNAAIQAAVDNQKINRSAYQIINTLD